MTIRSNYSYLFVSSPKEMRNIMMRTPLLLILLVQLSLMRALLSDDLIVSRVLYRGTECVRAFIPDLL